MEEIEFQCSGCDEYFIVEVNPETEYETCPNCGEEGVRTVN